MKHQNLKFLQSFLGFFLLFSSPVVQGRMLEPSSELNSSLMGDGPADPTWTKAYDDFFVNGRCSRVRTNTENLVDLSSWMSKKPNMTSTRLMDVALPGTHDSASYDLNSERNPNDPDYWTLEQGTLQIPDFEDVVKDWFKHWVCGYALTQSLSVSEQLQAGIRYLDLRFDFDSATGTWRAYHFLWGTGMREILQQVATFATAHPTEVIVLHFGGIHNPDVTIDQRNEYAGHINSLFAGKLVPSTTTDLATVTIGELQEAGTTIMAIVDDDAVAELSYIFWDDEETIENNFAPTDFKEILVAYNEDRLKDFHGRPTDATILYKLQWIFVPSIIHIRKNPYSGNLFAMAKEANDLLPAFKRPATDPDQQLGNILMVDFVEESRLFRVLDLQQYSDGPFIPEIVVARDDSSLSLGAIIGLCLGVMMLTCGLYYIYRWRQNKNESRKHDGRPMLLQQTSRRTSSVRTIIN